MSSEGDHQEDLQRQSSLNYSGRHQTRSWKHSVPHHSLCCGHLGHENKEAQFSSDAFTTAQVLSFWNHQIGRADNATHLRMGLGAGGGLNNNIVWEDVRAWRSYQEIRDKLSNCTSFEIGEAIASHFTR